MTHYALSFLRKLSPKIPEKGKSREALKTALSKVPKGSTIPEEQWETVKKAKKKDDYELYTLICFVVRPFRVYLPLY